MGRPRHSKNNTYPVGWTLRDIQIVEDLGLTQIGDYDRRTQRKRNVRTVRVKHLPCGSTRVVPAPWLGAWARQQARSGGKSRARPWCDCQPTPDRRGYVRAKNAHAGAHRVVMERILGRTLLPGENVHHRNGVRSDNRLENLELWVTSQPAGQRTDDIVSHAVEMLRRYAPHLAPPYPAKRLLG